MNIELTKWPQDFVDDYWQFDSQGHWQCPVQLAPNTDWYVEDVGNSLSSAEVRRALVDIAKVLQQYANSAVLSSIDDSVAIAASDAMGIPVTEISAFYAKMKDLFLKIASISIASDLTPDAGEIVSSMTISQENDVDAYPVSTIDSE
jgi:hypothetical protein